MATAELSGVDEERDQVEKFEQVNMQAREAFQKAHPGIEPKARKIVLNEGGKYVVTYFAEIPPELAKL